MRHGENPVCDDATFDWWLNISYRRLIALDKYLDKIITKKSNVDTAAAASTAGVNDAGDVADASTAASTVDGAVDSANGGNQRVTSGPL